MNNDPKLSLEDNAYDMVRKLADGNPGAATVLLEILKTEEDIDPDSALAPFGSMFSFDTHGIYGPRIWMLYKDVCDLDVNATIGTLRAVQLGIIPESQLQHAIDNNGDGLNVEEILGKVKERLPDFDIGEEYA